MRLNLLRVLDWSKGLAERAPQLLAAVGLAALGASALLSGLLELLTLLLAFLAAFMLVVLPRLEAGLAELRRRATRWYLLKG